MHEPPEGYGQQPYPNQPPGQGGYPPPQPPYAGPSQPPYGGGQQPPYGGGQQPPYGGPPSPAGDPWGQQGMGGGGFGPPDPFGGQPGWGPPPGPPKRSNSGPIIVVAIVAVLVVLGGGGAIVWALSDKDDKPTPPVAESTSPTSTPTDYPTSSAPSPSDSEAAAHAQVGDCLANAGTSSTPRMVSATCVTGNYKVLKRITGTSDDALCRGQSGYTTSFTHKDYKYTWQSYVLCMQRL